MCLKVLYAMHGTFNLLLKIRAKDLNHVRSIMEDKIRKVSHVLETVLMTSLKTTKEEQIVSLNKAC
jgi:DNA-binding Lrp family transcriptional regulator